MKRIATVRFAVLVLLATTCTAQPDAAPGNIRLLPGYVHQSGTGIDSVVGSIARKGGLVIEYDIGRLAGVYTDCKDCGWTNGELWRSDQRDMDGAHAVEEAIAGPALACVSRRVDASGSGGEGSATRAQACGSGTPRGFRGFLVLRGS